MNLSKAIETLEREWDYSGIAWARCFTGDSDEWTHEINPREANCSRAGRHFTILITQRDVKAPYTVPDDEWKVHLEDRMGKRDFE